MTAMCCWAVALSKETKSQIKARGGLEAQPLLPTRNFPQENSLFVEQAEKPVPRSPQETSLFVEQAEKPACDTHLQKNSLFVEQAEKPVPRSPQENSLFVEQAEKPVPKGNLYFLSRTFT